MNSGILEPINLGSSEMVSINQLVDIVEDIAKIKLKRIYDLDAPKGVMGRNSSKSVAVDPAGNPLPQQPQQVSKPQPRIPDFNSIPTTLPTATQPVIAPPTRDPPR